MIFTSLVLFFLNQFNKGLVPFCPGGKTVNPLPVMNNDDEVEVFALKKPVWSFKVIFF